MNKRKLTYFMLMIFLFIASGFILISYFKINQTIWLIGFSFLFAVISDRIVRWFVNRLYH